MTAIRFQVLGPLRAWRGDAEIELGTARQRRVLAVLLLGTGRTVTVSELIDTVWGESAPASVINVIQTYVGRLRRATGDASWLRTTSTGYQVDPDRCDLDLLDFRDLAERGRPVEALARWTGPLLADLGPEVRGSAQALGVARERLRVLDEAAEHALRHGGAAQVLPHLRATAAEEQLNEGVHAHLMLALAATGAQAEALAVYSDITGRLDEQLGIDPSPRLREAHVRVLRQAAQPPPEQPKDFWRGRRPPPVDLVGREHDLDSLARLLADHRIVTLVGPGGAGKSALAFALARRSRRVAVLELGPLPATADLEILTGILEVDDLDDDELLVLLDNVEHLTRTAGQLVERLLGAYPGLTVLATSRQPLGVSGEVLWDVAPLAVRPAVELFVRRARQHSPTLAPDLVLAAELCTRLDGIPLAVELAAARLRTMSVRDLLDRLHDQLGLLGGDRLTLPHQRSIVSSVEWSIALLDEPERLLLTRLSVFAGSFDLLAAEAVGSGARVAELLGHLIDRSLVQAQRGEEYSYRILIPIRDSCRALADPGELSSARDAHLLHLRSLAEASSGPELADRLHTRFADLMAALDWGLRPGGPALREGVELLTLARPLWDRDIGQIDAVRRWTGQALDRQAELEPELRGRLLQWAGRLAYMADRLPEARERLTRALDFLADPAARADVLLGLAAVSDVLLDDDAADLARAAVAAARRTGDDARIVDACAGAAVILAWRGHIDEADRSVRSAYEAAEDSGLPSDRCRWVHALVALRAGRLAEAGQAADLVLDRGGAPNTVIQAQICKAWTRVLTGLVDEALEILDEAAELSARTGWTTLVPEILETRAHAHRRAGRREEARAALVECLRAGLPLNDLGTLFRAVHLAALMATEDHDRSAETLQAMAAACRARIRYEPWPLRAEDVSGWEARPAVAVPPDAAPRADLVGKAARSVLHHFS
ncbi:BTAD domain-containing putative transcriptional regulator [Nonomuraea soli]|uniref:Putative ATPase/DNA-binding SARP family transcriptional activator n=1 Tax=Nonomuraea soli TaxID=1032476 RepID=A0A7W0CLK8_9ACTN|nr:BTAD domain-containing putative transcriptional regulator [Nonomuraea soli]MBA2893195.1 putative ATPase/DNA-binding SARP family transcriptional activator [Nonomuraea soli]